VPWSGGCEDSLQGARGLEDGVGGSEQVWDQFEQNETLFGVSSSYQEEIYTTPLDQNAMPQSVREKADRIAHEIESGNMASEVEERVDYDEDQFSSVQNSGVSRKKDARIGDVSSLAARSAAQNPKLPRRANMPSIEAMLQADAASVTANSGAASPVAASAIGMSDAPPAQVSLTSAHLAQHDYHLSSNQGDGFSRESKAKRGLITAHTAHSPVRTPKVSEMKRINALNLEPALPKLDIGARTDWVNFKSSKSTAKPAHCCKEVKQGFAESLEMFQKRMAPKQQREQPQASAQASPPNEQQSSQQQPQQPQQPQSQLQSQQQQPQQQPPQQQPPLQLPLQPPQQAPQQPPQQHGEMQGQRVNKGMNVYSQQMRPDGMDSGRKFALNPQAAVFTPSCTGNSTQSSQTKASGPGAPQFAIHSSSNNELLHKTLADILDCFYDQAKREPPDYPSPDWPDVSGSSYHDVLGQPSSANPPATIAAMSMPVSHWQSQAPGQMGPGALIPAGVAPNMMQQGFIMTNAPGGGQPGQTFQQLYATGTAPAQRPQGGGNVGHQQSMVFNNQQNMMGQPPSMAMPAGMVGPQSSQNPGGVAMGTVPKFASPSVMPMVMQAGQFTPGFMQQQGQGQPNQPGPQGAGPQQGQMMQPMFHRSMGGPPHQMSGHEG